MLFGWLVLFYRRYNVKRDVVTAVRGGGCGVGMCVWRRCGEGKECVVPTDKNGTGHWIALIANRTTSGMLKQQDTDAATTGEVRDKRAETAASS